MITAFPNLENTKKALYNTIQGKDVKFRNPSKPILWESKIIECVFACKVLKTLSTRFNEERRDYLFTFSSKIFYNSTTFNIHYNKETYGFEVKTGLTFKSGEVEIKNENVNLYDIAEKLLDILMSNAKLELPQSQYEFLYKRCNELKSLKEY